VLRIKNIGPFHFPSVVSTEQQKLVWMRCACNRLTCIVTDVHYQRSWFAICAAIDINEVIEKRESTMIQFSEPVTCNIS